MTRRKPNIEGGIFLFKVEVGGLVRWDPQTREIPNVDFLFLTSAKKKAEGLANSWRSESKFGNWSPSNPPEEPNHLPLRSLILAKSRDLTLAAVYELRNVYGLQENEIPNQFLVTDTHPSLSRPGQTGEVHLVKPDRDLTVSELAESIHNTWSRFEGPVDVQIASAYAMTDRDGNLLTNPLQDSVFIHYPQNPLVSLESVENYLKYLRSERFGQISDQDFVEHMSTIAGGIMNEILYVYAYEHGIEGVISHALSCPTEPTVDSILGMGAAGLTPAIVGWIEQNARR